MTAQDINFGQLGIIYAMLVAPLLIIAWFKTGLFRKTLISISRMSIQLVLVGLYLKFVFEFNNIYVNIAWLLVMISVAASNVLGSAGLVKTKLFPQLFTGIALSTLSVLGIFVCVSIRPTPLYDARYLIPIGGMLLGNCMRGNVICIERFLSGIRENRKEYQSSLFMGATVAEAVKPWFRKALTAALSPTVSTMATIGIVALPGMMTGQILGGSNPLTAIKYQMAIMIGIFVAVSLGAWLNLTLVTKVGFNDFGMLREDIFKK